MNKNSGTCPYCQGQMRVAKLACDSCGVAIEGKLESPSRLALLSPEDQNFIERFIMAGGSIKETETVLDMSYPAIRSRLDRVIKRLGELINKEAIKDQILDEVEKGKMTAAEAVEKIKNL